MKIRTKLILPISLTLFASFALFVLILVASQEGMQRKDLAARAETLSKLVSMTNTANVWNIDMPVIGANVDAFMENSEIIGIKVLDAAGVVMVERAKGAKDKGATEKAAIVKKVEIRKEEQAIGSVEVGFSDSQIRLRLRASASR